MSEVDRSVPDLQVKYRQMQKLSLGQSQNYSKGGAAITFILMEHLIIRDIAPEMMEAVPGDPLDGQCEYESPCHSSGM